jgi:tetratricopeptide (TPR) repeat protein
MLGGQYHTAIPVLRQAVAAAPRSSLTYAYALYDLGHSLRLAGDPRAAVPVLWQRLQIPNQTDVVRTELALALEALGQSQAGSNLTASNQNAQPDGHGRHHGSSGGAAPGPGQGPGSQGD